MMMADFLKPLPSPGVGARRRGPKIPLLPLSAFTPPNSGTSERFPLPPSPGDIHPTSVVDGHVTIPVGAEPRLDQWQAEAGKELSEKLGGLVLDASGWKAEDIDGLLLRIKSTQESVPVLAVIVPCALENGVPVNPPQYLLSPPVPVAISVVFNKFSSAFAAGVNWALSKGIVVDICVQSDLQSEENWEALEEFVDKAKEGSANWEDKKGSIVLSNILPPPASLALPLVKLLTHPNYRSYQSHIASLSLQSSVFIKFLPPQWDEPTPPSPMPNGAFNIEHDTKEKKAWKRRIKMYLGPCFEAFGFQRIVFGSSPGTTSNLGSNSRDWYELAREALAELGVEQEGVDAVFGGNAKGIYSA